MNFFAKKYINFFTLKFYYCLLSMFFMILQGWRVLKGEKRGYLKRDGGDFGSQGGLSKETILIKKLLNYETMLNLSWEVLTS